EEYALLISTCAGTWRYLIGDTIKFTSLEHSEIVITGRTKFFLSLVGEHLSVDNMTSAIKAMSEKFNVSITEFTVAGIHNGDGFGHKWYIGTDDNFEVNSFTKELDLELKRINDDYEVERNHALKHIEVVPVPVSAFYKYMEAQGKVGSQNKFPRVLKGDRISAWENFL